MACSIAVVALLSAFASPLLAANFDELSAQAAAARSANDVPRAIELYRQALELNPKWQEGWWFLGSMLYDTDQFAPARDALRHFVVLEPNAAPGFALLGLSEYGAGEYAPALQHIERALASGTDIPPQMDVVLRYHEAVLLTRDRQFDEAMQKYVVFARNARSPNEPVLLGMGLAGLRRPLTPNEVPAQERDLVMSAGRAAFLILTQDFAKADESLRDLVRRFPDSGGVHYMYGCFLLASAPEHAIAELKQELALVPSNTLGAAMLAWALLNRHDAPDALPYARQAAAATPESPTSEYVLGRALAETGDVQRGIEHLEKAAQRDPANLENHLALAYAYSKAGRTGDAQRERTKSVRMAKGELIAHP